MALINLLPIEKRTNKPAHLDLVVPLQESCLNVSTLDGSTIIELVKPMSPANPNLTPQWGKVAV